MDGVATRMPDRRKLELAGNRRYCFLQAVKLTWAADINLPDSDCRTNQLRSSGRVKHKVRLCEPWAMVRLIRRATKRRPRVRKQYSAC